MSNEIKIGLSLDLINRHHQEPNRNRYESKYFWEELYPLISTANFNGIEIPYEPIWKFGGRTGVPMTRYTVEAKYSSVQGYLAKLKSEGIDKIVGIHFDPSLFMRGEGLDFYFGAFGHFATEAIDYAAEAGADYMTVTPTPAYGLLNHYFGKENDMAIWSRDFLKRTAEAINQLAEKAKEYNVTLVLKSEYWSLLRGDSITDFLHSVDESVRLDIDPAHIAISGHDPVKALQDRASLIGSIHLTDTAFVDDANVWQMINPEFPQTRATQVFRDLGQGNIDLKAFYNALKSVNYSGWAIVSCRQSRDPMRSILRSRHQLDKFILSGL